MINLKKFKKTDFAILILLLIAALGIVAGISQSCSDKSIFNDSCKKEYVAIEKIESVKLMWELIQVQDHLIQILLEQNNEYDKFLSSVQGLETSNKEE